MKKTQHPLHMWSLYSHLPILNSQFCECQMGRTGSHPILCMMCSLPRQLTMTLKASLGCQSGQRQRRKVVGKRRRLPAIWQLYLHHPMRKEDVYSALKWQLLSPVTIYYIISWASLLNIMFLQCFIVTLVNALQTTMLNASMVSFWYV